MELWQIVLAIIGILVAIIAPWVIYRKQSPKQEVLIAVNATSLLNREAGSSDVTVHVSDEDGTDRVVTRPHVAEISVHASGRGDIARGTFDGTPISIQLGVPIIKDLTPPSYPNTLKQLSYTEVGLEPVLLKAKGKGPSYEGRYLCEGKPTFDVPQSLLNVDVKVTAAGDIQQRRARPAAISSAAAAGAAAAAGVAGSIFAIFDLTGFRIFP